MAETGDLGGLRLTLAAGALFDAGFALPLLAAPSWLADLVGAPLEAPVTFRLVGVLLLMVAGLHALAARDPRRYRGNVVVAIAGRAGGGALLAACSLPEGAPGIYLLVGIADLGFAAAFAVLGVWLLREGRGGAVRGRPEP